MKIVRLDGRATDLWEGTGEQPTADRMRVFRAVRDADRVIDAQDRIIKDGVNTNVPRSATLADIEAAEVVQG